MLGPSAHTDTFARDKLPPPEEWPDFLLDRFNYPARLNAAVELTDRMVDKGFADRTALIGNGRRRTYKELADWTNRIARALMEDYGSVAYARGIAHGLAGAALHEYACIYDDLPDSRDKQFIRGLVTWVFERT